MFRKTLAATAAVFALSAGAAFAQSSVIATTDLNVRAGPGPQHAVIGVIGAGQSTTLNGCLENSKWCTVATTGGEGWVYSDYLTGEFGGQQVVLTDRPADSGVIVVPESKTTDGGTTGAIVGGTGGAIAGAFIGGPVGAAVGGAAGVIAGGTTGQTIDPPEQVRTYVSSQQVSPIYLEGEAVIGAGLPETVELQPIPDYEYRYVNVNGQVVLVEPGSRRIVHILR